MAPFRIGFPVIVTKDTSVQSDSQFLVPQHRGGTAMRRVGKWTDFIAKVLSDVSGKEKGTIAVSHD